MLIKHADDKSQRVRLLTALQQAPALDIEQRKLVSQELRNLRQGIAGERDAAHYIDNHFANDDNVVVIHDLRLVVDGAVAQIDHLLIERGLVFYLLETKHFNGNLQINAYGEFSVAYSEQKVYGIPSPLEQSRRHQNVLLKLVERLAQSDEVGPLPKAPEFRHVVLVNPQATIARPEARQWDTSNIIKADQFASWRDNQTSGETSVLQKLGRWFSRGKDDAFKAWAAKICAAHRAPNFLFLPPWLKPQSTAAAAPAPAPEAARAKVTRHVCAECAQPVSEAELAFCQAKTQVFQQQIWCRAHQPHWRNLAPTQQAGRVQPPAPISAAGSSPATAAAVSASTPGADPAADKEALRKKLICCTCGARISYQEGKFCWAHAHRFGGFQYCRAHQSSMR